MSLILKSNKKAAVSFPNASTINTSAELEFSKYTARVMADGGRIVDPDLTLKAFQSMFQWGLYGNYNSWVGGRFGVKTNAEGRILKLYAVDGHDVIGKVYGAGELPLLTAEGVIDFSANLKGDTENGGMLTTEQAIRVSKSNDASLGMFIDYTGSNETNRYKESIPAAISTHGETAFGHSGIIAHIYLAGVNSGKPNTYFKTATHPLVVGDNKHNNGPLLGDANNIFSFHLTPSNDTQLAGYKDYYLNTFFPHPTAYQDLKRPIANISDYKFYLDFGGEDRGEGNTSFFYGKAKEFFSLSAIGVNSDGSPLDLDRSASMVR